MDSPSTSPRSGPAPYPQSSSILRNESLSSGVGASLGARSAIAEEETTKPMRISLQLEASKLPNMDRNGRSDPFVVLYRKIDTTSTREEWVKVGQTETVYNNLSPKWSTTFPMEYRFGSNFVLRFSIYDRDSKDDDLSRQDYIGQVRCTVAQIVLADNQRLVLHVKNDRSRSKNLGTLTIRGEEDKGDLGDSVTFQFAVSGLRRGRKPFYVLSRKNRNDEEFGPVIYSEVHQNYSSGSQQTNFKPTTKSLATLVNSDMDRELKVEFFDYDRRGHHYRGGFATFTLKSLKTAMSSAGSSGVRFNLRKRKSNHQVVDAGVLTVKKCDISIPYSFLDYIRSGTVMNLVVAVDMSATNGNPADPSSLQYNNRQAPNEYVIALREVGNVLAAYDASKTFPAFGFGAALPPSYSETAHCFALTGNIMQPVCNGIEGVIDMYYNALNNVAPYRPCLYGPVLEHVIRMTKEEDGRDERTVYTVLLLVTDGDFVDFPAVANLICAAADLPLSIVIVGVGNSRFVQLERLDGDDTPLCSTDGTPCGRDIVQFVQFHNHRYNTAQLAREVLDEIPGQLVSYMRSKSIKPSDIVPNVEASRAVSTHEQQPAGPYIPTSVQRTPTNGPISPPAQPMMHMQHSIQQPGIQAGVSSLQYSYNNQGAAPATAGPPAPTRQPTMASQYSGLSQYGTYQQQMPPTSTVPAFGGQSYNPEQAGPYAQPGMMQQQASFSQSGFPPQAPP